MAINILKYFDAPDVETMKENTLRRAPFLDVGVKIQAVYMACAALDINCLARMTFDEKESTRYTLPYGNSGSRLRSNSRL